MKRKLKKKVEIELQRNIWIGQELLNIINEKQRASQSNG